MERPNMRVRLSLAIATLLLSLCLVVACDGAALTVQPSPTQPPTSTPQTAATKPIPTAVTAPSPTATAAEPRPTVTAAPPTAKPAPTPTLFRSTPTAATAGITSGVAGAAWIGTFGFGVNALDKAGWHAYATKVSPLPSDQIKDIAVLLDNRVWITHSLGLSVTDGTTWNTIKLPQNASSPAGLAGDAKGGVWVAHFRGVSYYDGTSWTTHEASKLGSGANVGLVKDVAVAPDGKVWVVTANSVAVFSGTAWTFYEKGKGLDKDYYFEAIAVDLKGIVWAAHGSGVLALDGTNWTSHEGSHLSQTKCLAVDAGGLLWAGTYARGASVFDGKGWVTYNRANSELSSDNVRSLAVDSRGRVWLGTEWGLSVLVGKKWTTYHMHTSGLADNDLYALAVGGDGPELPASLEKAPGSLSGKVFRGRDAVSDGTVVACSQFIGLTFTGPSPCADNALSASAVTDGGGEFAIKNLPIGRYGLSIKSPDGKWSRLTTGGIGDRKYLIVEGKDTYIGEINLGQ